MQKNNPRHRAGIKASINIYVVVAMYSSREEKKKKEIGHCIHASDL